MWKLAELIDIVRAPSIYIDQWCYSTRGFLEEEDVGRYCAEALRVLSGFLPRSMAHVWRSENNLHTSLPYVGPRDWTLVFGFGCMCLSLLTQLAGPSRPLSSCATSSYTIFVQVQQLLNWRLCLDSLSILCSIITEHIALCSQTCL